MAMTVSTVSLWLAYSILVFTFPIMVKSLGEYIPFIIYAVICLLGFVFIKTKIKETKGKTLEEVESETLKTNR
jgi:hypothetical protein